MTVTAAGLLSPDSILAILKVALGFGLVIFLHEFGHFIMARRNGVFVEKFAIGFDFFGAKLFTWRRGGTEYVVGAFPLGGYVKMKGQHDLPEEHADSSDEDSFQSKTVWQRTQIISAGVIANFLSAFALCYVAMLVGYHTSPAEVGSLSFDSLQAGLEPGDRIVSLAGKDVGSWDEVVMTYATQEPGSLVPMRIERGEETVALDLRIHRDPRLPINYPDFRSPVDLRVGSYEVGSAAHRAGLEPGDWLREVDGIRITSWAHFQRLIRDRGETALLLGIEREVDGQLSPMELCAYPDAKPPDHFPKHILGFEPQHDALLDFVAEGSTGWEAGLRQGDRIVAVGSTSVQSWYGAWLEASWEHEEAAPVALTVQRGERTFEVTVPQGTIPDWGLGMAALPSLGLASRSPDQLVVGAMGAGAPEGLRSGDVVVSVTGRIPAAQMTDDMEALPESDRLGELRLRRGELACELRAASGAPQAGSALPPEARAQLEGELASVAEELAALESPFAQAEQPGGDSPASRSWSMEDPAWGTLLALANSVVEPRIEVEVLRDGKRHTLTAVLQERSEQPTIGYLGVAPLKRERLVKYGPVEAIVPTLQAPFKILRDFVAGIRAMLNRRASAKMLAGPVGILQATYSYAEKSTGDLANFLALLSVNLAVVNFLPIPITDGGHFVFLMYEKVKGRRMDEELEARFQWAGLVFILLVFLFATFNDVGRIFGF